MYEELAQYKYHIVSAKEIGKALLQGVPDTSHSTGALQLPRKHCTMSIQFEGQFSSQMVLHFLLIGIQFFSSSPEYEPARKVKVVSSTKTRGQIQSEQKHSEEEATFESPQAQP